MSINSASDAKMFNQLCSSGKADSSQVKTTTAPVSSASPITGGLTTQTTIKTTYTSAYTQEELAALQKKDQGFFSSIGSSILSFFKNNFGAGCTVIKQDDYSKDLFGLGSPVNASLINKETEVISKMGDSSKTFSVYCIGNSSDWLGSSAGIKINIFNQSFNLSLGFKNIGILFRRKGLKLKIVKGIGCIIGFLIILIMPFENLFLKFDTPEQAFNYGGNNWTIIDTIENEKSALIIYDENGSTFSTLVRKSGDKWKAAFLPEDQDLFSLGMEGTVLITRERNSNNFYIMIAVDPDIKSVTDNQNSNFELFSKTSMRNNYVAYVENCTDNYIIDIDGSKYQLM